MAGLLNLSVNKTPSGGATYSNVSGIMILGTSYNGANIYSVAYNSLNVIYENANQKWAGSAVVVNGYDVTISPGNMFVIFIKTPYS